MNSRISYIIISLLIVSEASLLGQSLINFIAVDDKNSVYLNCDYNTGFLRFNSDGGGWTRIPVDPRYQFNKTLFTRNGYIYCPSIFRSIDSGMTWQYLLPINQHADDFCVDTLDHIYYVNDNGAFRSTDYGDHWEQIMGSIPNNETYPPSVAKLGPIGIDRDGAIFLGADFQYPGRWELRRSTDNGNSWTPINATNIWGYSDQMGFAFSSNGNMFFQQRNILFHSGDRGMNWEEISPGYKVHYVYVHKSGEIFVGTDNGIYECTLDGDNSPTWNEVGLAGKSIYSFAIDSKDIFYAGSDSLLYTSADHGVKWSGIGFPFFADGWNVQTKASSGLFDLCFPSKDEGFAVGGYIYYPGGKHGPEGQSIVLKSTDSGATWSNNLTNYYVPLYGVSFKDSLNGIAVGYLGLVIKTSNGGSTFKVVQTDGGSNSLNGAAYNNGTYLAVGDGGIVLKSTDEGETWQNKISGTDLRLQRVKFLNNDTAVAVGGNEYGSPEDVVGLILYSTNGGDSWSTAISTTIGTLNDIEILKDGSVIVVGNGSIWYSIDRGRTWNTKQSINVGSRVTNFSSVSFYSSNSGIAVGNNKYARTVDGGNTWFLGPIGQQFPQLARVVMLDTATAIAVSQSGEILVTKNGGGVPFKLTQGIAPGNLRSDIPTEVYLSQSYPNPFNSSTMIVFSIPRQSYVTLQVFNLLGQRVAQLVSRQVQAGFSSVRFDGSTLASGIYFYQLKTGNHAESKKMILLK